MSDPRFPDRPDHPDLWLISQGLVEQDAMADQGQPLEDMVARYVDIASITYVVQQRTGMSMQRLGIGAVVSRKRVEAMIAAAWMDAFVQGIRFQNLKSSQTVDQIDLPPDAIPVVAIYTTKQDAGVAYTLRLPDGSERVVSETGEFYGPLANLIDDVFTNEETDATYPYAVGHAPNDAPVGPLDPPLARFRQRGDAESFIEIIARSDPDGVDRGDYYVDGPEE